MLGIADRAGGTRGQRAARPEDFVVARRGSHPTGAAIHRRVRYGRHPDTGGQIVDRNEVKRGRPGVAQLISQPGNPVREDRRRPERRREDRQRLVHRQRDGLQVRKLEC